MSDLISRKDVKGIIGRGKIVIDEGILECDNVHEILVYLLNKVEDYVEKAVDELPSVQQWIPCSERLPNNHDNILINQSDGYVNVGYYSLNYFKDVNSYPYKDVIAWMPLPEPYKGE